MSDFKGRHFEGEVILWSVRWYCRSPISYRDLEEMLTEHGLEVDDAKIYRWVQRYRALSLGRNDSNCSTSISPEPLDHHGAVASPGRWPSLQQSSR